MKFSILHGVCHFVMNKQMTFELCLVVWRKRKSERIKGSTSIKSQKFYMMYEDKLGRWLMRCFSHMCPSIIRLVIYASFRWFNPSHAFIFALSCFSKYIPINLALTNKTSNKKFIVINAIWLIFFTVAALSFPTYGFGIFQFFLPVLFRWLPLERLAGMEVEDGGVYMQ